MRETLHIYAAGNQPAHNFVDDCSGKRYRHRCNPRALRWCFNCDKRRWAKYLTIQVYYDAVRYFCRDGRGCAARRRP